MRRVLRLLARMYPVGWRDRYGDEFDALLEDKTPRVRDVFDLGWGALKMHIMRRSFVRIVLPCSIAGVVVAMALYFAKPPQYGSRTILGVRSLKGGACGSHNNLPEFVQRAEPSCIDKAASDRFLKDIKIVVTDRELLVKLIQEYRLYPNDSVSVAVDEMRKNIHVKSTTIQADRLGVAVEFDYFDLQVAQKVSWELFRNFINTSLAEEISNFRSPYGSEHPEIADALNSAALFLQGPTVLNGARHDERYSLRLDATFPQSPVGLNWVQMCGPGLLGGFLCGVVSAVLLKPRGVVARG